jgi:predicted metal-dependent peptidase
LFKQLERTYRDYNPLNYNPYGMIFPVERRLSGMAALVIIDTSSSMPPDELTYALDMVNHLIRTVDVYLVEIDVEIQRVRKIKVLDKNEFTFKGRGGTSFAALEKLPQIKTIPIQEIRVCFIITDGRVDEFPSRNPIPQAKWVGITTAIIPENSPSWIQWYRVEQIMEEEEKKEERRKREW